eukprot:gene5228-8240_t
MRLSKGKKQLTMEAQRPVGMEEMGMRFEQQFAYTELRAGVVAGRVPVAPTNHAYAPGVTYGTAHRLNQACQLAAMRARQDLQILMEDKGDAYTA